MFDIRTFVRMFDIRLNVITFKGELLISTSLIITTRGSVQSRWRRNWKCLVPVVVVLVHQL